ncbi:hypothetical protein Q4E93_23290 [Flavitalea sp. BT771]|uniref:hypothetical protein n=1 Tax=Flavitalea sp. BT771 TaxID=3063329 RepID=UPI0026E39E66|nr:hypothetical protein [Flavitalea sp. BT771]MDO6433556.1 hypothetical protein [Flavitalea sp. BT771]MDV6222539.1 hypothetical protein [Flavitalea sp. BT771]
MRNASFGSFLIAALLACYLINCFSPLRLEYDSIHYFALKDCLEHSCPPGFQAADDPRPYGYPALLWLLSRMCLLYPFTIALVNLVYLAGALYFTGKLFQHEKGPATSRKLETGVVVLLLGYPFIKYFAYPLSEMQYLFFACGSLFFFRLYTDRGMRAGSLVVAFLFAGAAIFTRAVGIALVPALLAGLGWHHREVLVRHWKVAGLLGLVTLAGLFAGLRDLNGMLYLNSVRRTGPGWKVLLGKHLAEWGELLLNVPAGKFATIGRWIFIAAGLLLMAVVFYCLMRRKKKVPVTVSVYMVLYSVLIFSWPFFDVRFWIPVAPLVVMILLQGLPVRTLLIRAMVALYVVAGLGALVYSTYTAFDKRALARNQAGGRYRNEYETHFFGKPLQDTVVPVDPYVLHVLETCK